MKANTNLVPISIWKVVEIIPVFYQFYINLSVSNIPASYKPKVSVGLPGLVRTFFKVSNTSTREWHKKETPLACSKVNMRPTLIESSKTSKSFFKKLHFQNFHFLLAKFCQKKKKGWNLFPMFDFKSCFCVQG